MEKRRRCIWCRWIKGKSDLLFRGNFKLGFFWLGNMGVECGEILVFIYYGVDGGFYS